MGISVSTQNDSWPEAVSPAPFCVSMWRPLLVLQATWCEVGRPGSARAWSLLCVGAAEDAEVKR